MYNFKACKSPAYVLPRSVRIEHGPHTPGRAKNVEGLGEAVIVNQSGIYGEQSHEQDDVASPDQDIYNLNNYN